MTDQLTALRNYFESGATKSYAFRKTQLEKLRDSVEKHEEEIYEALFNDLKKSKEECWITENGFLLNEIKYQLRKLKGWMQPRRVSTNLLNFPGSSYIMAEPLGTVLIIGPWNYPFQLLLAPLAGAIAAGNTVVLKPSEFAPHTAAVIKKIITSCFPENYVLYAEGEGATVIPAMMDHFVFDHVFFTGSTVVGKKIYEMAAKNLVPVTLELGGKSPCVVEEDANIEVAARRIVTTKFSNAGQMCVAPDYILVHESKKQAFIESVKDKLQKFYGDDAKNSPDFGKIINQRQFERVAGYLKNGRILCGGKTDAAALYIEPTLMDDVDMESPLMQEEIFGPVLPVISFLNREEALRIIDRHKNPLAFYIFTSDSRKEKSWLDKVAFGGGCVNNASYHLTNHHLPFGGRGNSGMGRYHGRFSFDTFSHKKAVMKTAAWFDPSVKYPPFGGKLSLFKKVFG
ncbi:MAG: aldehyde dehydrogenase [Ferruginibacter sp.]